jgi:4-hydroxy-4-methyl-2-oxoglutarate aldolase
MVVLFTLWEGKTMKYLRYREKLEKCYSAVIMDVMDGMNVRVKCMDPAVKPLVPTMKTWGEAVTVYVEKVSEVPKKPFQLEMEVIDDLKEGQIIVAQCNAAELSAFWGGLLSNAAVGRKSPGAIMDGGARDYREIVSLNFPVFCKGLSPYDSCGRMDGKERDIPIVCGGIRVLPGDLVYGDVDGVVVVPQEMAEEVITRAWEKVKGENTVREELRAGASVVKTFEKYGIL